MNEEQTQEIISKVANGEMNGEEASAKLFGMGAEAMNRVSDEDVEIQFESQGEVMAMYTR